MVHKLAHLTDLTELTLEPKLEAVIKDYTRKALHKKSPYLTAR